MIIIFINLMMLRRKKKLVESNGILVTQRFMNKVNIWSLAIAFYTMEVH